jgi:hypothetical protein
VSIAKRVEKRAINPADFAKNLEDFFVTNRLKRRGYAGPAFQFLSCKGFMFGWQIVWDFALRRAFAVFPPS